MKFSAFLRIDFKFEFITASLQLKDLGQAGPGGGWVGGGGGGGKLPPAWKGFIQNVSSSFSDAKLKTNFLWNCFTEKSPENLDPGSKLLQKTDN